MGSTLVSALTASAVAYGARSFLTRKFVGEGISLTNYNLWTALGAAGLADGFGWRAAIAAAVCVILGSGGTACMFNSVHSFIRVAVFF